MSNPYTKYYVEQAGTGIAGFQGLRYQRGSGFFGRLLSKAVYPLLRFLGGKALTTGTNIASDVLVGNKSLKDAAKSRLEETGKDIANAGLARAQKFVLEGKGRKRKRKQIGKGKRKKSIKRERKENLYNIINDGRLRKKAKFV